MKKYISPNVEVIKMLSEQTIAALDVVSSYNGEAGADFGDM